MRPRTHKYRCDWLFYKILNKTIVQLIFLCFGDKITSGESKDSVLLKFSLPNSWILFIHYSFYTSCGGDFHNRFLVSRWVVSNIVFCLYAKSLSKDNMKLLNVFLTWLFHRVWCTAVPKGAKLTKQLWRYVENTINLLR